MTRLDDHAEDIFVEVIDFGKDAKAAEMVVKNEDGSFTVFLNARVSHDKQMEALEHGVRHVTNDDFSKTDVQQIEADAHHIIERRQQQDKDKARLERRKQRMERRRRKALKKLRAEQEETVRRLAEYQDFVNSMEREHPGLLTYAALEKYEHQRKGGF